MNVETPYPDGHFSHSPAAAEGISRHSTLTVAVEKANILNTRALGPANAMKRFVSSKPQRRTP
jgi:hypothetical protein